MTKIKGIFSVFMIVVLMLSSFVVSGNASGYLDVEDDDYYAEAINALTIYGVVSGYDGKFNPDAYVTRAEFSKMAALIAGLEDEVYSSAGNRRFDDVSISHWGNGYINTVANNKIIVGYPDGLFMPEKNITFAEAVTVVLRTMDFSAADLGDNWPYSYMVKANSLGITSGFNIENDSFISRGDLCVIINRALQTDMNKSKNKLFSKMNISLTNEVLIVATKNEDAGLDTNQVKTNEGTYRLANTNLKLVPLSKGRLVLNSDNEVINFASTNTSKNVITTVDSYINGVTYFTNGKNSKDIGVTDSTPVYNRGSITSYGAFKNDISEGVSVSIVYDEKGTVSYLLFNDANYTSPAVIRTDIYNALASVGVSKDEVSEAKVIRNGYAASLSDAKVYDVAYYLADNKTIYLYNEKVSGIYTDAYPNKANVTSVEISGNVLELETQTAAYKLGEKSGSYKLNQGLTALIGRTGKVVDVVDLNSVGNANYGILLSVSNEMSDDTQTSYINIINGEGTIQKIKTQKDYSQKIGDIGKISYDEDGNAIFSTLSTGSDVSGKVDKTNRKIGEHWLTSDCVILARTYAPETRTGTAKARTIDFEEINVSELNAGHILYAVKSGQFDDISLLIVENVTNDMYTYGVLTDLSGGASDMSVNASYTVFSDGSEKTYQSGTYNNITVGSGVAMVLDGTKLISINQLTRVGSSSRLDAISYDRIKVGNTIYRMGTDVRFFQRTASRDYKSISLSDATELIGKTVNIYIDKSVNNGGMIRVVIFN